MLQKDFNAMVKGINNSAKAANKGKMPLCYKLFDAAEKARAGELFVDVKEGEKAKKYTFAAFVREFCAQYVDRKGATLDAAAGCFIVKDGAKYALIPELDAWSLTAARRLYYAAQCGEAADVSAKRAAAVAYVAAHKLTAANAAKYFDEIDAARKAAKKADAKDKADANAKDKAQKEAREAAAKDAKDKAQKEAREAAAKDAARFLDELVRLATSDKAAKDKDVDALRRGINVAIAAQASGAKYSPLREAVRYFERRERYAREAREAAAKAEKARAAFNVADIEAAQKEAAADAAENARINLARAANAKDAAKEAKDAWKAAADKAADAAQDAKEARAKADALRKEADKAQKDADKAADKAA